MVTIQHLFDLLNQLNIFNTFLLDNYLLVGNRLGHIFLYTTSPRVQLVDCNKTFSKRPIIQLTAISECQIVICLSGTSLLYKILLLTYLMSY